jgi:hypothetical protein
MKTISYGAQNTGTYGGSYYIHYLGNPYVMIAR